MPDDRAPELPRLVPSTVPDGARQMDLERLAMLRVGRFFEDRIRPAVTRPLGAPRIAAWVVGGEPVPFAIAATAVYAPVEAGTPWGRPWDTVWFRVDGDAPEPPPGCDLELDVDLGFTGAQPGFQAEGLVYTSDGTVVKGIEPRNAWAPLHPGPFTRYIEAAANPTVALPYEYEPTPLGDPETAGDEPLHRLRGITVVARDREVAALAADVEVLAGLAAELPPGTTRRSELVVGLERAIDAMDPDDVPGTAAAGRAVLAPLLAAPAVASSLRVNAVGHAHIDSAWLWPVRETKRKVARTVANVLDLLDRDPGFVFAMSSAQQYAWLAETQPALFERLRAAVAAGRFRPVGGMWVESDTNMPGGEALARQLIAGKRWFLEHLGVESDEVWLPDSFGYSAALPGIIRAAGSRYFLTQKPSWNETNRIPHSSFRWQGIDGSAVFTHLPPAETYNSDLGAADLARTERVFAERGRAREVMGLFGFGDGGGGPTREMLETAQRKRDLEGSARVEITDPHTFFSRAEAELADPATWTGELYLELHRGTLISQQRTKRGNRRSEAHLHEAELWAATAAVLRGTPYPYDVLEDAWHTVLLLQFHDILPGSSIAWVYRQAEAEHARIGAALGAVIESSLAALGGSAANAGPYAVDGVPAMGTGSATAAPAAHPEPQDDGFVLDDGALRVVVDAHGALASIRAGDRELVPAGLAAGVLQRFRDTPRQWDAWDIDAEDQRDRVDLADPTAVTADGDAVVVVHEAGGSRIEQRIRVEGGRIELHLDIDWHERQKLLKLAFPLDVAADRIAAEIQFGHVHRPTHRNTSWETARFETVAHRWIHAGEPGFGVAIANDATYGFDVRADTAADGSPMTVARLSLLRAPVFPDPHADQGGHVFDVSVAVGGIPEAVALGYRQNLPLRGAGDGEGEGVAPLVASSHPAVVVETVKLAEDRSGDVVVRLYEAFGTRAAATLTTTFDWASVVTTDLLERPIDSDALQDGLALRLRPFQLVTLRFRRR